MIEGEGSPPNARVSAEWSVAVLRRAADFLEQEVAKGKIDSLSANVRLDVLDLFGAAAEAARAAREVYDLAASEKGRRGYDGAAMVREHVSRSLPLNRKERFYTGTVLPMIVAGQGFEHVGRFLELCGLAEPALDYRRDGGAPCQLITEYGFFESLVGSGDQRWDQRARRRDTPDVVLAGADWLLAFEAKMFDRPTRARLNEQIAAQAVHVAEWADVLRIPDDRVRHVALLPRKLALEVGVLSVPTVTWEEVADLYRIVGPAYWVGVLDVACERWSQLVSPLRTFGANAEAKLTGEQDHA